jgi:hypothetical protein
LGCFHEGRSRGRKKRGKKAGRERKGRKLEDILLGGERKGREEEPRGFCNLVFIHKMKNWGMVVNLVLFDLLRY